MMEKAPNPRPSSVKLDIHTGMLESLGINMYTSLAKCLVEFIANSFDADATKVEITIPFDDIAGERNRIRTAPASPDIAPVEKIKETDQTLSDALEIVITDDGHGMSVAEIEEKFLPINRNRRLAKGGTGTKSESGKRTVMGRKGLGKLAGFGIAETVTVWSKREGESYATQIVMDFNAIRQKDSIGEVSFDTVYEDGLPDTTKGTRITLGNLRFGAMSNRPETVNKTIAQNFMIAGAGFEIFLNGEQVVEEDVDYEFVYPPAEERKVDDMAEYSVHVADDFDFPILYKVQFRKRDGTSQSLPSGLRGARIYCNKRLAAGPTLLDLHSGMHNFHSQSYMECVVHADVLDQSEIDLIGTNRANMKTDNEIVEKFNDAVTEIMRVALYEHSKYRDSIMDDQLKKDPVSGRILGAISQLGGRNRQPALRVLKGVAKVHGIGTDAYEEIAHHFISAFSSSEVLLELVKLGTDPTDLADIADKLAKLAEVERSDALKLYRARKNGISALQKLQDRSHTDEPKYETELHALLKECPWLVQPDYDRFLTSNKSMDTMAKELTRILSIDDSSPKPIDSAKRPDLVSVLSDPTGNRVAIFELKSPNIELDHDHLTQLKKYMLETEEYLDTQGHSGATIKGHLIGNLPRPDTQSGSRKLLLNEITKQDPTWEVLSIPNMLERARRVHMESIKALEHDEEIEGEASDSSETGED